MNPGGQVLLDSGPARVVAEPEEGAAEFAIDEDAGYPGEAWIELEYRGERGPPFRELYAESETLYEHASAAGWSCEFIYMGEHGSYVARLTRDD